jgi:hypothetical protein
VGDLGSVLSGNLAGEASGPLFTCAPFHLSFTRERNLDLVPPFQFATCNGFQKPVACASGRDQDRQQDRRISGLEPFAFADVDGHFCLLRIAGEDKAEEGGMVSLNEADQLSFRRTTEEDRAARLAQVRQVKSELTQRCEVLSSIAVADIPPEKRNQSTELLGLYNLEAISVAKDRNAVLWIDDLVVGFVANADFGVKSMWTQLMLRCFVYTGSMSIADFNLVTAKLAAWNYVNILWNPETIIAAGIAADWKMDSWPLSQCLALIAKSPLSPQARVQIVIEFWRLLRHSECGELRQTPIIQATLDAIGDARAVRWLLQRIDQIFALDLESALFIRPELVYWLRTR